MKFFCRILLMSLLFLVQPQDTRADDISLLRHTGMVTMVNFGTDNCLPCRMMKPVIKKLKSKFDKKASILFINIEQHRETAFKYGIKTVPVQIFYDQDGREVFRHVGYFDYESSLEQFRKLNVD